MIHNYNLICPVRGPLDAAYFSKDGLTVTEEARRIECIKFLISKNYPIHTELVRKVGYKLGKGFPTIIRPGSPRIYSLGGMAVPNLIKKLIL